MHVNQPPLLHMAILGTSESQLLVNLVACLHLLKAFCKLIPVLVSLRLCVGRCSAASSSTSSDPSNFALSGAASSESGSGSDSWGEKYGMIALGLIAGNLLVGVILLAVTLTVCVRGMKGRSSGRYAPVPVKFKEPADRDAESNPLRYSD